jgi:two-component system OmpR family sensor kinase
LIATVVGMVADPRHDRRGHQRDPRNILSAQLDNQVQVAVQRVASQIVGWQTSLTGPADAYDVLTKSRLNTSDILLVVKSRITGIDGAYQSGNDKVVSLSDAQVDQIIASFTKDNAQYTTVTIDDVGTYRLFIAGVGNDIIMVGLPLSTVSSTIAQILTTVALVTTGGLLLLAAVIALVIRYSLRPLRAVAATATRVAGQQLDSGDVTISERVAASEADATDEIGRVGAALNTLLDHVDASLAARQRNEERMRSFVADASHELRTPLAAIRGYSELSLRTAHGAGRGRRGDTGTGGDQRGAVGAEPGAHPVGLAADDRARGGPSAAGPPR